MSLIISSRNSNKSVQNLNADGSYVVPNGTVIDTIRLLSSADMAAVKIGITPGGEEILSAQPLTSGQVSLIGTLITSGTTVYFTGITAPMQVTFFKK
jgi:hypothetical protein